VLSERRNEKLWRDVWSTYLSYNMVMDSIRTSQDLCNKNLKKNFTFKFNFLGKMNKTYINLRRKIDNNVKN